MFRIKGIDEEDFVEKNVYGEASYDATADLDVVKEDESQEDFYNNSEFIVNATWGSSVGRWWTAFKSE